MIEETYVSFETAKLLKEKGFGECSTSYISEDGDIFPTPLVKRKEHYPAPTQQMAMKWLREKHNLVIQIELIDFLEHGEVWFYCITERKTIKPLTDRDADFTEHSYEEAVEEALKYCLTKLI